LDAIAWDVTSQLTDKNAFFTAQTGVYYAVMTISHLRRARLDRDSSKSFNGMATRA
jgi:hypothetical protein